MRGRLTPAAAVLLILAAIGAAAMLIRAPGQLIIPLVVFGIIFLLYKFPPGRSRRGYRPPPSPGRSRRHAQPARKKPAPFKVIEGSRKDDDRPRYH